MWGGSSAVGTSKVPSHACEFLKFNENMNMLLSKIEALTEAQGVTEVVINKLIFKRGIYLSSRISEPFTPVGMKRRRNQISRALTSAKKKASGTSKMMDDQPTERLPVNLYKPYPGGVPWLGAKRIFTVMTLEKKYFVSLEFMINDGVINV
ncbi:hypothetical protein HAX54_019362 [Datura stramonium]|uniref:Uncharacterized protein n=1 Tax=Datura stramonium TaxID=4076 RepID=A0ABS8URB2_DATST|nr:hypothetical protein [Datura stramonium]